MGVIRNIAARLVRVREIEAETGSDFADGGMPDRLPKCLTTLDLISLGVGSCMGTGMYVVSGMVAREMAGPGVILSFLIAAAASLLSGKKLLLLKTIQTELSSLAYYDRCDERLPQTDKNNLAPFCPLKFQVRELSFRNVIVPTGI